MPIPWQDYRTRSQGECQHLISRVRPASDMSLYFRFSTGGTRLSNVTHYPMLLTSNFAFSQAGIMVLQLAVILQCLLTRFLFLYVIAYPSYRVVVRFASHLSSLSNASGYDNRAAVRSETLFLAKILYLQAKPKARLSSTSLARTRRACPCGCL